MNDVKQSQRKLPNGYTAKRTGVVITVLLWILLSLGSVPVKAYDCVLDTDGDGIGDGTAGANSSNNITRIACGNDASAAGVDSIAVGRLAEASGNSSIAIGERSTASAKWSTAIGQAATAIGISSTAVGKNAFGKDHSTAVGQESSTTSGESVAIGYRATAGSSKMTVVGTAVNVTGGPANLDSPAAIAIGYTAQVNMASPGAIAIGGSLGPVIDTTTSGAEVSGENAIAIGFEAKSSADSAIILGANGVASGDNSTAVGTNAVANGNNATAMGASASATTLSTAMGAGSAATGTFASAFGYISKAESENSTSLGYATGFNGGTANTDSPGSIAIGYFANIKPASPGAIAIGGSDGPADIVTRGAEVTGENAIAIGFEAQATRPGNIAHGGFAMASGFSSAVALGGKSNASGSFSTALGSFATVSKDGSTALGTSAAAQSESMTILGAGAGANGSVAVTDSPSSIAIGYFANIKPASPGAIAIGGSIGPFEDTTLGAESEGENAIAIGFEAKATQPGAIAIGADVVADIPYTLVTNVPILARDPDTTVAPRTMFEISGFGNTKFTVTNADKNEQWAFANPGTGFRLSRQGSGSVEFEVKNNGNAVLAGTLTENSDINEKHDIQQLNHQDILEKVIALPISQWRYKDDPDSKHIGPMAQDFYRAFELGDTDKGISSLDSSGVALAAIQALKQENSKLKVEKDTEISELKTQMTSMQKELAKLKALKQQLALVLAKTGSDLHTQVISE